MYSVFESNGELACLFFSSTRPKLKLNVPFSFPPSSSSAAASTDDQKTPLVTVPTLREYFIDLEYVLGVCSDGPAKSFAFRRLKYLASKWNLYTLLNEYQELADMKRVPHRFVRGVSSFSTRPKLILSPLSLPAVTSTTSERSVSSRNFNRSHHADFSFSLQVDTHVHHSASMNQKHLLRFIKSKMKRSPDELVCIRDGQALTLNEVFDSLGFSAYELSIDTMDMHVS